MGSRSGARRRSVVASRAPRLISALVVLVVAAPPDARLVAPLGCAVEPLVRAAEAVKSPPSEDAQGKLQPIRCLYACSFASGARDTAESVTSWLARWTTKPSNPSAIAEQDGHPAV